MNDTTPSPAMTKAAQPHIASRPTITSAARTPKGARLELDTGEVLQVPHEENAGMTSTRPYILRLEEQDRALTVPPELVAQVAQALGIASRAPEALSAAPLKPVSLIVRHAFDHLPHVAGVELLPSGAALLHLESGQVVEVPKEQNARFTPDGYTPSVLTLPTKGPLPRPAYVVPDSLRLPTMRALGFDLSEFEGRAALPHVVAVELLPAGVARLTLDAGYIFTLSREGTPRASLSPLGADGLALLLTDWQSSATPAFLVPAAVYDEVGAVFDEIKKPALNVQHLPIVQHLEPFEGGFMLHLDTGAPLPFWDGDTVAVNTLDNLHAVTLTLEHDAQLCTVLLSPPLVVPALKALGLAGEDIRAAFPDAAAARHAYYDSLPTLEDTTMLGKGPVFTGRRPDGAPMLLEVSPPARLALSYSLDSAPGEPLDLTIYQGSLEAPTGCFTFAVYEDTPQGAAVLAKLRALTERVSPFETAKPAAPRV